MAQLRKVATMRDIPTKPRKDTNRVSSHEGCANQVVTGGVCWTHDAKEKQCR